MSITKHVGKHNNKKIVVLWRQVPNENHMALVTYSDTSKQEEEETEDVL